MIRYFALAAFAVTVPALAGPLDPPAGPIAPTNKTLTQVEPRTPINAVTTPSGPNATFKIAQPGSYYLTENVTGVSGKHGIEIAADNVTIDLNGFTMTGVTGALEAACTSGLHNNIVVKGGTIQGWPGGGVNLNGVHNALVTGLTINSVGGIAILVSGRGVIQNCSVDDTLNASFATASIQAGCCSLIDGCSVRGSMGSGDGILVDNSCIVRNCVVGPTSGVGIHATGSINHIEGCIVAGATGGGISVSTGSTVRACTVDSCLISAIMAEGADNRIERNNVRTSRRGIYSLSSGNIILGNSATGNTSNFDINNGNVGLFMTAATGVGFVGSNGGTSPGTSDTNTNYAY